MRTESKGGKIRSPPQYLAEKTLRTLHPLNLRPHWSAAIAGCRKERLGTLGVSSGRCRCARRKFGGAKRSASRNWREESRDFSEAQVLKKDIFIMSSYWNFR
ncbi:hypothetical protein AVEN_113812-1 [Araneus ventricosus]|uniref:Uncharacterized protein n=1 Tax=Araneus ventricosus TaxID=182803 RepID=A0A4Y2SUL2_ARAVE|nr:hypothetical protein AVEN_250762-1 [Araneus ventricosus]GBN91263.1 hypothetical protein AVEN_113812-1 [Araneus ventricosus]